MTDSAPESAHHALPDLDDPAQSPLGVYPVVAALPPTTFIAAPAGSARAASRRAKVALAVGGTLAVLVAVGAAVTPTDSVSTSADGAAQRASDAPGLIASPGAAVVAPATSPPAAAPPPATTDDVIAAAPPRSALAILGSVAVKGRAPRTGYARDRFGAAWADTDRNGCDTRNDILQRDLTGESFRPGTRDCVVMAGTLAEPYTGRTVQFRKADANAVQIDHVVSLSNAWQTGAFAWPDAKRLAFANDPLNLLAVDGPANMAKSDGDAATWLPPNSAYRCAMVARQTAVKAKYQLWVTPPEREAIARVLARCPAEPAPSGGNPTTAPVAAPRPAAAQPPPSRAAAGAPPPGAVRDYANCDEMNRDYPGGVARPGAVDKRRGGGAARYRPYYSQALYDANVESDGDSDGIACEQ